MIFWHKKNRNKIDILGKTKACLKIEKRIKQERKLKKIDIYVVVVSLYA